MDKNHENDMEEEEELKHMYSEVEEDKKKKKDGASASDDQDDDMGEKKGMIKEFKEITGVQNEEEIVNILKAHDFKLEEAVLTFLAKDPEVEDQAEQAAVQGHFHEMRRSMSPLVTPYSATSSSSASSFDTRNPAVHENERPISPQQQSNQLLNMIGSRLLSPLRLLTGANIPTNDSRTDARKFVQFFERTYGPQQTRGNDDSTSAVPMIRFLEVPYRDAVLQASRERKLLFVYLHGSDHPDTDSFCRDVLCSRNVANAVNNSMIAWGGDMDHPDAYRAFLSYHGVTFPFIGILAVSGGERISTIRLVDRVDGKESLNIVYTKLTQANLLYAHVSAGEQQSRREAEERAIIRAEQDRELQRAMEEDRLREEQVAREMLEQQRLQEEYEAKIKQELEEAERKKNDYLQSIEHKRNSIKPEPNPSTATSSDVLTLRFQFPEGTKINRSFYSIQTIGEIRDFLDIELFDRKTGITSFSMSTNYPKRTYLEEDRDLTILDAGLKQRDTLFIHNLDA